MLMYYVNVLQIAGGIQLRLCAEEGRSSLEKRFGSRDGSSNSDGVNDGNIAGDDDDDGNPPPSITRPPGAWRRRGPTGAAGHPRADSPRRLPARTDAAVRGAVRERGWAAGSAGS